MQKDREPNLQDKEQRAQALKGTKYTTSSFLHSPPTPLFYRQDTEDKCKWKTEAFTLGHYSGNFHLCLVTWAGSTQPWNPHPVPK